MSERTFRVLSTLKVSINHCLNKVVVCTVAMLLAISKCCEFYTKKYRGTCCTDNYLLRVKQLLFVFTLTRECTLFPK